MSTATAEQSSHHGHHPRLAHHFDSMDQQFDAGKLGMWLFLATEVLFFGGLFLVYSIYRSSHPDLYHVGQYFLDWKLGAANTIVLIFSSFTAAWAVRAAQLNQKDLLVSLLTITLLCAATFMVIKYFEYSHKWEHGVLWGNRFNPSAEEIHHIVEKAKDSVIPVTAEMVSAPSMSIFFSIYFFMTGLHGVHVLVGMGLIGWLIVRAKKGHFDGTYYGPVDNVALYWHIVDLIWIFLFPLFYLIG